MLRSSVYNSSKSRNSRVLPTPNVIVLNQLRLILSVRSLRLRFHYPYFMSKEVSQQIAEQRRALLRRLKIKKKQDKACGEAVQSVLEAVEQAIESGQQSNLKEQLKQIEPERLLAILYQENQLGVTMVALAIDRMSDCFFRSVADMRIGLPSENDLALLRQDEQLYSRLYGKLLRQIIGLSGERAQKFTEIILSEYISQQGGPLLELFRKYIDFDSIRDALTDHPRQQSLLKQCEALASKLGQQTLAKKLSEYAKYLRCQHAWNKDTKIDPTEDIASYQLPEIGINILHYFAEQRQVDKFMEQASTQNPRSMHLYNEFNCSDETPTDVALRKFPIDDISKVVRLAESNRQVHLSVSALNKILDNSEVYKNEDQLPQLIRQINSPKLTVKGYVKKIPIGFGQFDYREDCQDGCLLKNLDGRQQFPMLKYLRNSSKPRQDILQLLMFKQLQYSSNTQQWSNFLKINEVTKKITFQNHTRQLYRRISGVKSILMSEQVDRFDTYIKQLVEAALKGAQEPALCFIIQNVIAGIFIVHLTLGADLFPHLLRQVIRLKLRKPVELLIARLPQLIAYKPTVTDEQLNALYKSTNFVKRGVLWEYSTNLVSELLHNFSELTEETPQLKQVKAFLKKELLSNPSLLNSTYIRGTKAHFVINKIWFLMGAAEAAPFYGKFCEFLLAKHHEDTQPFQEQPGTQNKAQSQPPKIFLSYAKAFSDDLFADESEDNVLSVPLKSASPPRKVEHPVHQQFLQFLVGNKQANALLEILLKEIGADALCTPLVKLIASHFSELPRSITEPLLAGKELRPVLQQLALQNKMQSIVPYIGDLCKAKLRLTAECREYEDNDIQVPAQDIERRTTQKLNKEKQLSGVQERLNNLLATVDAVILEDITYNKPEQVISLLSQLDGVVDWVVDRPTLPLQTISELTQNTAKQVTAMARLGIDSKVVLVNRRGKAESDKSNEPMRKAVEYMIKDGKSFVEVACFYGVVPIASVKEFIQNNRFLARAASLVQEKKTLSQGYTLATYSFQTRLAVLERAIAVWPSKSEEFGRVLSAIKYGEPEKIMAYAERDCMWVLLDMYLTKTGLLRELEGTHTKQWIEEYFVEQAKIREKGCDSERVEDGTQASCRPEPFKGLDAVLDCFRNLTKILIKQGQIKSNKDGIHNVLRKHFTPGVYYLLNFAGSLNEMLLLATRMLDEKLLLQLATASIRSASDAQYTHELFCEVAVLHPGIYLKLLKHIAGSDVEFTQESRHFVFLKCLTNLILKSPQVAYSQLELAFENDVLTQSEYDRVFQTCRMKGDAKLVLTMLFFSKQAHCFRIFEGGKAYNILENPIVTMKDSHFSQYLESALKYTQKDNARSHGFARQKVVVAKLQKEDADEEEKPDEPPQREYLQGRLQRDYYKCLVAGNWTRALQIVTGLEKIGANLSQVTKDLSHLTKYWNRKEVASDEPRRTLCNKIYTLSKSQIKQPVPWEKLLDLFKLNPQALKQIEVQPLSLSAYLSLLMETYKSTDSVLLQKKVQEQGSFEQTRTQLQSFLQLACMQLESNRIKSSSAPYYKCILSHLQFLKKMPGWSQYETEPALVRGLNRLRSRLLITLQSDPAVTCIFEGAQLNRVASYIFTNKGVDSYGNLLKVLPGLLSESEKQLAYKKLLLKYGSPLALRQLVQQKQFTKEDAPYVIGCGDLATTQEFIKQVGLQEMRAFFNEEKHLNTLMVMGNEQYSISLIQQLELQELVSSFDRVRNIFDILCLYKRTKLFNFILGYLKSSGKLDTIPADTEAVRRTVQQSSAMPVYGCLFISQLGCRSQGFSVRQSLLDPSVVNNHINQFTELPAYQQKLRLFKSIRSLMEGNTDAATQKQFGLRQYEVRAARFCTQAYNLLLRMVLGVGELPTFSDITGLKQLDTNSVHILLALRVLVGRFAGEELLGGPVKLPASPLLALLLLYDPSNKRLLDDMKNTFPGQFAVLSMLYSWFPEVVFGRDTRIVRLILSTQQSKPLQNLIFKNFQQEVVAIEDITKLIVRVSVEHCFWLLPELVRQNKLDHLLVLLQSLEQSPGILFTLMLLLASNFPSALPICMQTLQLEATNSHQLLLKLAGIRSQSYFQYALKTIRTLEGIDNYHALYSSQDEARQDIEALAQAILVDFEGASLSELKGSFSGIDISSFLESLKTKALAVPPKQIIKTQLSIIRVYSHLLDSLQLLVNLNLKHRLSVVVRDQLYDAFNKDWLWLQPERDSAPQGRFDCIVNIIRDDNAGVLASEVNIEQFTRELAKAAELQLYFTTYKEDLATTLRNRAAVWHGSHGQLMDLQSIRLDEESFRKIGDWEVLTKMFGVSRAGRSSVDMLLLDQFFDEIEGKLSDIDSMKEALFEIDNVSAPHNNGEQSSMLQYFPELYVPLSLQCKHLELVYVSNEQFERLKAAAKEKVVSDVLNYLKLFRSSLAPDSPPPQQFTSRLYYSSSEGKVKLLPHYYSAWNILETYSTISGVYNQLVHSGMRKLAVSFGFQSAVSMVLAMLKLTSQSNFFEALSKLLKAPNLFGLLHALFLLISDSGANIESVIKGIRVEFAECGKSEPEKLAVLESPHLAVCNLRYSIASSVMKITIDCQLGSGSGKPVEAVAKDKIEQLISQQDLFNCIFSTPEQLTNYFLDRRNLDMEIHRIANSLSQNNSKMVHVSVDYESLYAIVRELEKSKSVAEIGSLLARVFNYVRNNLQDKLAGDYGSSKMRLLYQLHLNFLAQAVCDGRETTHVQDMVALKSLLYSVDRSEPPLRSIPSFSGQVAAEHRPHLVNTFMIQIYRRYFMSSFLIGNVYVLGFENRVTVLVAKDRNSINSVDVQSLKWVLWLTRKLPDEVFLDPSMVIGLYICDLTGNFFKVNDKFKAHLLDPEKEDQRQLEINELIPVLPTNVLLKFVDPTSPTKVADSSIKRSESVIRSPFENQTIILTLNTGSGNIKQSEFNYPAFSLVHHFRLSTSIQARVQSFRRFLTEFHEDALDQQLEFSFHESLGDLPEMELFENTLNVCLYELEKVYEEFSKLQSRDKVVEENIATIAPHTLLNKNYLSCRRLAHLRNVFKRIELCFCEGRGKQKVVEFKGDCVTLFVDLKSSDQNFNFMAVLEALVDEMTARLKFSPPKDIKFEFRQEIKTTDLQLNDKLRLLDILLLADQQATNCRIVETYNKAVKQPSLSYACLVCLSGEPTVKVTGSKVALTISVKENIRLHTFCDILCSAYKLAQDPLVNGSRYQFTEYNLVEQSILLYNCVEPVSSIVTISIDDLTRCQYLENASCTEADSRKKITLPAPKGSCIYVVRTPSTLSYNVADPRLELKAGNFRVKIGEPVSMLFNILSSEHSVLPLDKIALSYRQDKLVHQLLNPKEHLRVELRHPTRNVIGVTYTNNIVSKVTIKNPTLEFPHELLNKTEQLEYAVETESFNQICVEKTKCMGLLKGGKMVNAPEKDGSANNDNEGFFVEPPEKAQTFRLSAEAETKVDIAEILSGQRPMTVAEKQFQFITKAGHERIEVVTLRDSYGNEIKPSLEDISFVFEYVDNPALKMVPTKEYSGESVRLNWEPFVRGRYNLFINDTIVDPGYEIIVSAEDIDLTKTKVELPNIRTLSYCEQSSFSVRYRDRYGNIFSDLEHKINKDGVLLEMAAYTAIEAEPSKHLQFVVKDVDQFGVQTCQFHLNLPESNESEEVQFHITILFMREELQRFDVKVRGLSVEKRKSLFNNELNQINRQPQLDVQIVRNSMLDKLVSMVDQNLVRGLSIRFDGEPGVDAGGLKREFYDLVGSLMKNEKYPFFKPIMVRNRTCYTPNPDLLRNKKKEAYMKTFGKFLASSILNNYLIGIDFADSFVKALYGETISFNDLKDLVGGDEFSRYEHMLKATDSELEDMMVDFTVFQNGKEVELQEGGASKQVNRSNVAEYLDCIADFKIRRRFEEQIQSFLEGFNTVFSFDVRVRLAQMIKKWFQPREFSIYTCGIKELEPQNIIDLLIFDNSKPMIEEWFKRYIRECKSPMLSSFLKFTTGASTVPFDTSSYKIEVVFVNSSPKKLPISHTCWKSLEVPYYKSYEQLEKKLNTAFTFGAEGFGFA